MASHNPRQFSFLTQITFVLSITTLPWSVAQAQSAGRAPQAYENITAIPIPIEQVSKTIIGQDFKFPSGVPNIRAFLIELPVGKPTSLHTHEIPLLAYVVSGTLEVDYGSKGKKVISAGTGFVEAINWCHIGRAVGKEPAKVLGFYLGENAPLKPAAVECKKPD
jgi:quercetin dioxygenase-like cupin family protein